MDQLTLFGTAEPAPDKPRRKRGESAPVPDGAAMEMFSAREIAQFGVNAKPQISLSPNMPLPLMMQDPRSDAEREADRLQAERDAMLPLPLPDNTSKGKNAMNENQYNGWTNYPTWAINLWAENDSANFAMIEELVAEANAQQDREPRFYLADRARAIYEDEAYDALGTASEMTDILIWALQVVNWDELAAHWIAYA